VAATERRLNELQASLVELAGAVRVARQRVVTEARIQAEPPPVPAFVPDPEVHAAVAEGVLRPGSAAEQAVTEVVDDFAREP
jgi:hypothetical protein